jgi:hypothetical protein
MADIKYTEMQLLQAKVEIEEEYGTLPLRWELSEGQEMDAWYSEQVEMLNKMAVSRAVQLAWLEKQS